MNFPNKISLAKSFSKRPKLGFRVHPVTYHVEQDDTWSYVKCTEEEVLCWSVFCLIQDGYLVVEEWIADLDTPEGAENLRSLLCNLCGMDNCRLLTKEVLMGMMANEIIGEGVFCNRKLHVGLLKWVAVRTHWGKWEIRWHLSEFTLDDVLLKGEIITDESIVRGLIPCDKEAWGMYRK